MGGPLLTITAGGPLTALAGVLGVSVGGSQCGMRALVSAGALPCAGKNPETR